MSGRPHPHRYGGSILAQIEEKFLVDDGCWPWLGEKNEKGYGIIYRAKSESPRKLRAHRVLYELLVGPIPEGLQLDHTCHNHDLDCAGGVSCPHRACVRPSHMEPVTPKINVRRGRRCKAADT